VELLKSSILWSFGVVARKLFAYTRAFNASRAVGTHQAAAKRAYSWSIHDIVYYISYSSLFLVSFHQSYHAWDKRLGNSWMSVANPQPKAELTVLKVPPIHAVQEDK
jgi:hypothetical protein